MVRNSSSLLTPNKDIYPGEPTFLHLAYNQATNKPYGYILLDLNPNTPEKFRVDTDIFDNEITVYLPMNSKKVH